MNDTTKNNPKLQTVTDVIGKHWGAKGLSSNKLKENNAGVLILDTLFEGIIKKDGMYSLDLLKSHMRVPNENLKLNFQSVKNLLHSPLISENRYKALMGQEIHQYFLESSQETQGYTDESYVHSERHSINLKNLIAYKMISSSTLFNDLLNGWQKGYFAKLQENPDYLLDIAKNKPEDVRDFLISLDSLYEKFIFKMRSTLDRCHIYILPFKNHYVTDIGAYFLDLTAMNVPLEKIQSVIPFGESHQEFLKKIVFCPISETHCAVAVPLNLTFNVTYPTQHKHLIQGFVNSDLHNFISFTNAHSVIIPIPEVFSFLEEINRFLSLNKIDFLLMSRALATLPRRNIDAIMEVLQPGQK